MTKTVTIAADLPAPPAKLYAMYLDPRQHEAFTGQPATIESRAGGTFRAFDGVLTGTLLQLVPDRLIVQAWRSANWPADALDSTLILHFVPRDDGARIELTQVNVPEVDFAGVCQGWEKFYWSPWRAYLSGADGTA